MVGRGVGVSISHWSWLARGDMVGRGTVRRSSSVYMYTYNIHIMCMYYGVVQGLASPFWRCIAKKGGEGEDTGLCLVLLPPVLPQRRDCGLHHFRGSGGVGGPGFAWALGATARRAEPQPPALPAFKQERRQLFVVCGGCRGGTTTRAYFHGGPAPLPLRGSVRFPAAGRWLRIGSTPLAWGCRRRAVV